MKLRFQLPVDTLMLKILKFIFFYFIFLIIVFPSRSKERKKERLQKRQKNYCLRHPAFLVLHFLSFFLSFKRVCLGYYLRDTYVEIVYEYKKYE